MELPENIELNWRAFDEVESVFDRYEQVDAKLAERFRNEFLAAAIKIAENPLRWPRYTRRARYVQLRRFPYLVIYQVMTTYIHVVALAHTSRRPGYWRRRLRRPEE